jgi:Flp pilus assembly protein TadB
VARLKAWLEPIAACWPGPVQPDESLRQSLGFLGADTPADVLLGAGYTLGTAVAGIGAVVFLLGPGLTGNVVGTGFIAIGVAVTQSGPSLPGFLARLRRTRALGAAPALLTRATLRMRLTPVPERAARFAARTGEGPLAVSLRRHVERSAGGPGTGLEAFAGEWKGWFPAIDRSATLLESAGDVPEERRFEVLDRARSAVLEGARERAATFGTAIQGPSTAVYAFGVLLPLALVALLPALRTAGVPTPLAVIVVVYDLLLPAVLLGASAWLLVRRPLAFPPPPLDRTHPDVADTRLLAVAGGLLAAAGGWLVVPHVVPSWTAPLAAIGFGSGTALVVAYHPMVDVRERVRAIETGLPDALALVGRQIASGQSAERALAETAADLSGPIGDVFADAARRQRQLGVDLQRALLGPDGALAAVPSRRTRTAARTLVAAAEEGTPAGETVVAAGDHLDDLARVERETRRSLEEVTSTLSNTAAVFGPLVGGATVALAAAMTDAGPLATLDGVGGLGLAVGGYVLVLAILLTALATGLARGLDRSLVGYRVGLALLAATATYLTAFAGAGLAV